MTKITLVQQPNSYNSFRAFYFETWLNEFFNFEYYDNSRTYDASATVFYHFAAESNMQWIEQLHDRGYRTVVDNLWENPREFNVGYVLQNPNWFWYNESLWYRALGYADYQPLKTYEKQCFMSIRRSSKERDTIVAKFNDHLDDFIWSYRGRLLPNDGDPTDGNWQRYFNPDWYNNTYFSLVIETMQHGQGFITEKTFKPCAYYHPFVVLAQAGTIKRLNELNFATFENLFDESYDTIEDFNTRLEHIYNIVNNYHREPYDNDTWARLVHNHNHFFNEALVKERIIKEIIDPLLEYAQT